MTNDDDIERHVSTQAHEGYEVQTDFSETPIGG